MPAEQGVSGGPGVSEIASLGLHIALPLRTRFSIIRSDQEPVLNMKFLPKHGMACVLLLCVTSLVWILGCAGVVPMTTVTKTPANQEIKQKVSADFIVVGQTTKADLLAKLKPMDAGIESDRFFLARWSTSNMGAFYALCGYLSCAAVGAQRLWKTANVLLEFDSLDFVIRFQAFKDSSLVDRLAPLAAHENPVSFDVPREIQIIDNSNGNTGTLLLGTDTLEVQETMFHPGFLHSHTSTVDVQIDRAKIIRLQNGANRPFPKIAVLVRLSEKTKLGKVLNVQMSVPDMFLLLEYCEQRGRTSDLRDGSPSKVIVGDGLRTINNGRNGAGGES
jgi:hypothetical protein